MTYYHTVEELFDLVAEDQLQGFFKGDWKEKLASLNGDENMC